LIPVSLHRNAFDFRYDHVVTIGMILYAAHGEDEAIWHCSHGGCDSIGSPASPV